MDYEIYDDGNRILVKNKKYKFSSLYSFIFGVIIGMFISLIIII